MDSREYERVRELYHELADRPLDEARRELGRRELSETVRAEVEALLGYEPRMEPFDEGHVGRVGEQIASSAARRESEAAELGGPAQAASRSEHLPEKVAGYRVVELIGRGGMGVVYRGVQEKPRRDVAIKVMQAITASPLALRRFEYEAEILARLDHPYVAKVIEAGVDDALGNLPYIVMELVEGTDLLEHTEAYALSVGERLALFQRVCEGVEHAHQHGIVHRDLKPANVIVSPDGRPRILDFGIARPAVEGDESTPGRTQTGSVIGSLAWMSPEQASGQLDVLDVRSDVYSLGVVLYRLLAGTMPYELGGSAPWVAARRICEEQPKRLGHERPELRGDLEAIVARALEKEPAQRYPGAGALGRDIARYLEHQPVEARPWSASYQFAKFARRHRLVVGTTAALVLAIAVGLLSSIGLWRRAEAARKLADDQAGRAHASQEEAERERAYLLRLADLKRVRDLVAEAERYWPVHPDLAPQLEDWLTRAEDLAGHLQQHEAFLSDLQSEESPLVAALEPTEHEWWVGALGVLLDELRAFAGERGTLASVRARLESSRTIRRRSTEDPADAWARAAEYAADPDGPYSGLALEPQLGLVPFPPNPETELLEFWHVESGEKPERDAATGRITMWDSSAIVLVLVPGGRFLMGSQAHDPAGPNYDPQTGYDATPPHEVRLSPFLISRFELSQGQWLRLTGSNPSFYTAANSRDNEWPRAHPVEQIEWVEAEAVLRRAGLQLPTEAQWEYAARAGAWTPWWCGDEPASLQQAANLGDEFARLSGAPPNWILEAWNDGYHTAAPLGAFPPNAFGLHEVHGNVREWVRDHYHNGIYQRGVVTDPYVSESNIGPLERCVRGADFASGAEPARLSARHASTAEGYSIAFLGVRPGRALE